MSCSEFNFEDNGGGCGDGGSVGGSGGVADGGNVGCGGGQEKTPTTLFTLKWCWWQLLWVRLLNFSVFLVVLVVVLVVIIWL